MLAPPLSAAPMVVARSCGLCVFELLMALVLLICAPLELVAPSIRLLVVMCNRRAI